MRISALSARTEVPVGTIKYYLREGLLAPGRQTSRTTAEYDEEHVERIRLVRALTDAGGLGIAAVRRIVGVLDAPAPARLDVLATAQDALLHDEPAPTGRKGARPDEGAGEGSGCEAHGGEGALAAEGADGAAGLEDTGGVDETAPAREWLARRGWRIFPEDRLVARLERVWAACEAAGVHLDDELMDGYAQALEQVALLDVDSVPDDPDAAARRVVVGTVMLEPVLLTLRLLAQRELSVRRAEDAAGEAGPR